MKFLEMFDNADQLSVVSTGLGSSPWVGAERQTKTVRYAKNGPWNTEMVNPDDSIGM